MKAECPKCGRMHEEWPDGYFWCGFCQRWYLPLEVHEKRQDKATQLCLDHEEENENN